MLYLFIILAVICSSCNTTNNKVVQNSESQVDWRQKTIKLIKDSVDFDGGYSLLTEERPTSYTETLNSLFILGETDGIKHNSKLMKTLIDSLNGINNYTPNIKNYNELLELKSFLELCKSGNIVIPNKYKNSVVKNLEQIHQNNGMYGFNGEKDSPVEYIINTELSLQILEELGIKSSDQRIDKFIKVKFLDSPDTKWDENYKWSIYNSLTKIINLNGANPKNLDFIKNKLINNTPEYFHEISSIGDMVNLKAIVELDKIFSFERKLPKNLNERLKEWKLEDGGFSLISKYVSDTKFSKELVELFPSNVIPDLSKFKQEISKNELSNGLYAKRGEITSNIYSSYYALIIYDKLGETPPESLNNYFRNIDIKSLNNLESIYYYVEASKLSNISKTITVPIDKTIKDDREILFAILLGKYDSNEIYLYLKKIVNEKPDFVIENIIPISIIFNNNKDENLSDLKETLRLKINRLFEEGKTKDFDLIDKYKFFVFKKNFDKITSTEKKYLEKYLESLKDSNGGYKITEGSINHSTLISTYCGLRLEKELKTLNNY